MDDELGLEDVLFPWLALESPERDDEDDSVIYDEDELDEEHEDDCGYWDGDECDCGLDL